MRTVNISGYNAAMPYPATCDFTSATAAGASAQRQAASTAIPRVRAVGVYLLAFVLSMASVVVALWMLGYYPFGDATVVTSDLKFQYLDLLEWLRDVLQGNGNILYSFSKSLGGNMAGTYSYYLASPVNYLLAFWPEGSLIGFVTFSIVFRAGLSGVTSCFYVRRRFGLSVPSALVLALGYALCLYFTSEATNLMWLDAVVLMPLVMYGIWRIVNDGSPATLFISLLITVISCWYTGYMVCAFSLLYYLMECILAVRPGEKVPRWFLRHPLRFIGGYALAVCAAGIVLVPMVYSILVGKGASLSGDVLGTLRYPVMNAFYGFLFGVVEHNFTPQLYCGMLALLCLPALLLCKAIPRRERAYIIGLVAFLVVCTWFSVLDIAWTGFRAGVGYYCRWSFVVAFAVVFCAGRYLQALESARGVAATDGITRQSWREDPLRCLVVSAVLIAVFTAAVGLRLPNYLKPAYALGGIALCAAYPAILALAARGWSIAPAAARQASALRIVAGVLIVACAFAEAAASCYGAFSDMNWESGAKGSMSYARYSQYHAEGMAQEAELDALDASWHRTDKTYNLVSPSYDAMALNEGFAYRYQPLQSYLSTNDSAVSSFLCSMGYSQQSRYSVSFQSANIVSDSILGLKYVASNSCPVGYKDAGLSAEQGSGFAAVEETNRFYMNPYALPLAYGASYDVLDNGVFSSDPFESQERVIDELVGHDAGVFDTAQTRQLPSSAGTWTWQVLVPAGQDVYCYIGPECSMTAGLFIDGTYAGKYCYRFSQGVFALKGGDADRTVTVQLISVSPGKDFDSMATVAMRPLYTRHSFIDTGGLSLSACVLDQKAFESAIGQLSSNVMHVDEISDGHVVGTYTASEEGLLFTTVPYDSGWSVTVNGEKVTPLLSEGTFISIKVPAGTSTIEMSYTSPGLAAGIVLFAVSIALGIVLLIVDRKRSRRPGSISE